MRSILTVVLGALLVAGCDGIQRPAQAGEPAPDYGATTLDGEPIALTDLRGNVVLLNIWATWCPPCRYEMPDLQALHERHSAEGLVIVGVSIDGRGDDGLVRDFLQSNDITFPIWRDPEERVTTVFRAVGVPSTYLIDRAGTMVWRHMGPITADDEELNSLLRETL